MGSKLDLGIYAVTGAVVAALIVNVNLKEATHVSANTAPQVIERTITIIKEVPIVTTREVPYPVYEYLWKEPRQFESVEELAKYLDRPILIASGTQDCDDLARFFMLDALKAGYLVSTQIVYGFRGWSCHMLISTVIGNGIYYIEPTTNEYWWEMPLD
jgi:hypothetical protein